MAVKEKTLPGGELLSRLQRWMRLGWVEEHNTLGVWDRAGRRQKKRFYTVLCDVRRFEDTECGPFPPGNMMVAMGGALMRAGKATDEKWPRLMFTPALTLDSVWIDIYMQGDGAFARHERLQTVEVWAKQKRITIDFQVNNQKTRSTAVVKFGQYERREDAALFPSQEMVANLALALDVAGVDKE